MSEQSVPLLLAYESHILLGVLLRSGDFENCGDSELGAMLPGSAPVDSFVVPPSSPEFSNEIYIVFS